MTQTFESESSLEATEEATVGGEFAIDFDDLYHEEDFVNIGVQPRSPTRAKPGSEEKVLMLAARYAAGLPLWHDSDCYDHGPKRLEDDESGTAVDVLYDEDCDEEEEDE